MKEHDEGKSGLPPTGVADPSSQARAAPGAGAKPAVDMQTFIGRQLRAVYDDVAKQPVPDRFLELMKQLEAKPSNG